MASHMHTERPKISLRMSDADRLRNIAEAASTKFPQVSDFLAQEIDRAEILPDLGDLPDLVSMNSEVTFRDETNGQERKVTLVYPQSANVDAGKISILTPIGAALIGLSVGQTIEFQTPNGHRAITVLKASPPRDDLG